MCVFSSVLCFTRSLSSHCRPLYALPSLNGNEGRVIRTFFLLYFSICMAFLLTGGARVWPECAGESDSRVSRAQDGMMC
jgi:hypothetical protein